MKKLSSSFRRRIATVILLAGITGTFLSVYYFVYLPRQREQFNASTFRLLSNVTANFTERVANYGEVKKYTHISQLTGDDTIRISASAKKNAIDPSSFNSQFRNTFYQSKGRRDSYHVQFTVDKDFIIYIINESEKRKSHEHKDTVLFRDLLNPLTAIYSKTFSGIFLFRQNNKADSGKILSSDPDLTLYKPEEAELNIGDIYTDSLFSNKHMQVPAIIDTKIDDIPFKFFLVPFKMPAVDSANHTYVMAGLMDVNYYNGHIQNIPVFLLVGVLFVIVIVLLSLPFFKIFLISSKESLKISDIRSVIAVIFTAPFIFTLVASAFWIRNNHNHYIEDELKSLNKRIATNFYTEISKNIRQQWEYNFLVQHPYGGLTDSSWNANRTRNNLDPKDFIFYPTLYKNFTNVHWMDSKGNDIAVWNMTKTPATYFNVSARSYFQDVRFRRLRTLPDPFFKTVPDSFAIQPLISRLTGDYSISVSTKTQAIIKGEKAIVSGISSKMYSVVNPVLADGYAFCIIDSMGLVVCHSDTVRSLQENIFKESANNYALKNAVNHKDAAIIDDVILNDQSVKMFIQPMPQLPYYLVTYYQNRKQNLFVFHIIGFAFVAEVLVLVLASLFAYFIMLSKKRIGKLSFEPTRLNWLKPSPSKIDYYIKNCMQLITCLILITIFSQLYNGERYRLFWLNMALLMPVFVVSGYYLIKTAKAYSDISLPKYTLHSGKSLLGFIRFSANIYLLYGLFIIFYLSVQDKIIYNLQCEGIGVVKVGIGILLVLILILATWVARFEFKKVNFPGYLNCFIFSILLASFMLSVVPTLAFVNFSYGEEEKLQTQSLQIDLARKVQQRRSRINGLWWQTKLDYRRSEDSNFISQMKFNPEYGIYLGAEDRLYTIQKYEPQSSAPISCSPYFRIITQLLFLPPEHDDFYDDTAHQEYYYWNTGSHRSSENQTINLVYRNVTDFRDSSVIKIVSGQEKKFIFKNADLLNSGVISLLAVFVFVLLFYKIVASTTKRIFLLDYFSKPHGNYDFEKWLELQCNSYSAFSARKKASDLIGLLPGTPLTVAAIRHKEQEWIKGEDNAEELILELHLALVPVFESVWSQLSEVEKYVLFDFATDGFTNYKNMLVLYELYNKGLLVKEKEGTDDASNSNLTFMSMAFRNFLLTKENTPEIKQQSQENKMSSWSTVRLVFIMALVGFAVFLLITQQEATQRIVTIVTTLGTLLPLMLKLFDTSSSGAVGQSQKPKA